MRKVWDHTIEVKRGVCAEEEKILSIVERGEGGGERVY